MGINPRGLVPVLVHDGAVHVESNDIILHLEDRLAGPSLIPEGQRDRMAELLALTEDQTEDFLSSMVVDGTVEAKILLWNSIFWFKEKLFLKVFKF